MLKCWKENGPETDTNRCCNWSHCHSALIEIDIYTVKLEMTKNYPSEPISSSNIYMSHIQLTTSTKRLPFAFNSGLPHKVNLWAYGSACKWQPSLHHISLVAKTEAGIGTFFLLYFFFTFYVDLKYRYPNGGVK